MAGHTPDWPTRPAVHFCHHKAGTVWFKSVLRQVARVFGVHFAVLTDPNDLGEASPGLYLDRHSRSHTPRELDFLGSHMVRDPRDIVVSAYHYHLWSTEAFLHKPDARWNGRTYQEHLRALPTEEGLQVEIARCRGLFRHMREWDRDDPRILELRYEDAFGRDEALWTDVFTHYGLSGSRLEDAVAIGMHHSFANVKARRARQGDTSPHLRKGSSGQWQEHLTGDLLDVLEREAGDLLDRFGYR